MTEKEYECRISKRVTTRVPTGITIKEEMLTVEGKTMKECERAFDKRWKK